MALFLREQGLKSEFGFGTDAAESRSVAKRMSELLSLVLSGRTDWILTENLKIQSSLISAKRFFFLQ